MWYSSSWRFRAPISVDFSAWSTGASDIRVTLSAAWDLFWDNVASDGKDVRVCTADGATLVGKIYLQTWNYSTKSCVLDIEQITPSKACQAQLWLYWGNSAATTVSTSFTAGTPVTGRVELLAPSSKFSRIGNERPGNARTLTAQSITDEENRYVFLDLSGLLRPLCSIGSGALIGDELSEVVSSVVDDQDAAVATAAPITSLRFIGCGRGKAAIVAVKVDGTKLTDGNNYAVQLSCLTSPGAETCIARSTLYCRNVRPAA